MTTTPKQKDLAERIKNGIGEATGFQYLLDELNARKNTNAAIAELVEILGVIL